MNKRLFIGVSAVLLFISPLFAELTQSRRYVELGTEIEAGASNNYFQANEMLVKDVVIDLKKIADEMEAEGFEADFILKQKNFLNLNFGEKFHGSLFWGIEGSGWANVSKNLFKMIGKGFSADTNETFTASAYGDVFLNTGISFKTKIREHGIRITPAVFFPVVHVAEKNKKFTYSSSSNGNIDAKLQTDFSVYSAFSLEDIDENISKPEFINDSINEILEGAGLDIFWEVEHRLTETFEAGVYTRMPVIPGRLKHKMTGNVYGYVSQSSFLGFIDESREFDYDYDYDDLEYSKGMCRVNRPMINGIEGAWRPFGKWCIFRPKIEFVVRNPWTEDYQLYSQYDFSAEFMLLNVLGLYFGTGYENLTFEQTAGLIINARLLEIDTHVVFRGGDFVKSFCLTGAAAFVGVRIGY